MKIDKSLIKKILIATRDKNPKDEWVNLTLDDYDNEAINYHVKYAGDWGWIEIKHLSIMSEYSYKPKELTPMGHYYLDTHLAPWWIKLFSLIGQATGKITWIIVGAALGSVTTFYVLQLLKETSK